MPIDICGRRILAVEHHRARQHRLDVPPSRRGSERLRQQAASAGAIVTTEVEPPEVDLQFDHAGRQLQTALGNGNGLVPTSGLGQLIGIFAKRRRKRRIFRDGLAQLIQRLVAPAAGRERCREQGLDFRIVAAPRRTLQRCDGLGGAILHQKRLAQDDGRRAVAAVCPQNALGKLFRFTGRSHLQRQRRTLQRCVGSVTFGRGRRLEFRHRSGRYETMMARRTPW